MGIRTGTSWQSLMNTTLACSVCGMSRYCHVMAWCNGHASVIMITCITSRSFKFSFQPHYIRGESSMYYYSSSHGNGGNYSGMTLHDHHYIMMPGNLNLKMPLVMPVGCQCQPECQSRSRCSESSLRLARTGPGDFRATGSPAAGFRRPSLLRELVFKLELEWATFPVIRKFGSNYSLLLVLPP